MCLQGPVCIQSTIRTVVSRQKLKWPIKWRLVCTRETYSFDLAAASRPTLIDSPPTASSLSSSPLSTGARRVTMETRTAMQREREEQSSQMSHSVQLSSQIKKRTFTSRCEHAPLTSAVAEVQIIYSSESITNTASQVLCLNREPS